MPHKAEIVLTAINARFIHTAFGLRYLHANMGDLKGVTLISEFEVADSPREVAEAILARRPKIVGFGIYIWNVQRVTEVVSILRKVAPDVTVVIGGPEVSYEYEEQDVFRLANYLVTGEADIAFPELCRSILSGTPPGDKVISGGLPKLESIALPYDFYRDDDLAHRVLYVEASRGCPFTCEFCLSSIDIPVRQIELERVLTALDSLFQRGARTFKFVDRTFNLNVRIATSILQFFLDRMEPGLFVHFEMVPDRFPQALRTMVQRFPPGSLQFEVGIQSFNPEVGTLISRRQDYEKIRDNLTFLRRESGVYIHADLIAGLPGEDLVSFARGFDILLELDPHEIQVGILKRLRGTPIIRHDEQFEMTYSDTPPYEILRTRHMSFEELQRVGRFSRYWDLVANSGNFPCAKRLIWRDTASSFFAFMEFSDWLYSVTGKRSGINLKALAEYLFRFLVEVRNFAENEVGPLVAEDYCRGGRSDLPTGLRPFGRNASSEGGRNATALKRQNRAVW